jgi:hypothetical protein
MIEACAVGFPIRSVCTSVVLCSHLTKISQGNLFGGSLWTALHTLHRYILQSANVTAPLPPWHHTIGIMFSYLERLRERTKAVMRMRRHKENPG